MANYELIPFEDAGALALAAAKLWIAKVDGATNQNRPFDHRVLVALSGGRIARQLFAAIVTQVKERQISLAPVHFFWADERCVSPEDAESNFKVANELLFRPLAIPPEHIHRIRGEVQPEEAAREATSGLRITATTFSGGQPVLDLVLLGMGEDGHVASLFPTLPSGIADSKETYLAVTGPKPPPQRISLSYAAIAAARDVWVLASGPRQGTGASEVVDAERPDPVCAGFEQARAHDHFLGHQGEFRRTGASLKKAANSDLALKRDGSALYSWHRRANMERLTGE